jgi:cytochrome c556
MDAMTTSRLSVTAAALLMATGVTAQAQDADPKKEAIEYRQSVMKIVGWNFRPMGAMVKGERPFETKVFAAHAKDLAAVSSVNILAGFPEDTDGKGSKAKPEIWMKWDDFKDKMGAMQREVAKLGEVAAGGDEGAIKKQFGAAAKTCKACHDDYKE